MNIAVIDYGAGNLFSVRRALEAVGAKFEITESAAKLTQAEKLILPGVGAFADGMRGLKKRRLVKPIRNEVKKGKPILGICLGLQLLMEEGFEFGKHEGLGLIEGKTDKIITSEKLPQIGWNQIKKQHDSLLLKGVADKEFFYFVHSFVIRPKKKPVVAATTNYGGDEFCSVVNFKNIYGTQFHPEKSGTEGLKIYQNFKNIKL